MSGLTDEFAWIDRLRPLTRDDPRALGLRDDAAVLPSRPGFDLVVTKDAMVEGVHVLPGEAADIIARRLLRTNLSDLAAKAAEPFGYFLMTAWPPDRAGHDREAFAEGLARDGEDFGLALLGGDTVSTPGPLTVSATMLGWAPAGRAILRSGARAGDRLVVCGAIGDGWLGLAAARGEKLDHGAALENHYRLPTPLLVLRDSLRDHARAAADVSDGLLADAGHIATASGLGLAIDIDRLPLSPGGAAWLSRRADRVSAVLDLAAGGDDYALACAISPGRQDAFVGEVAALGVPVAVMGRFLERPGFEAAIDGAPVVAERLGWRHTA
jgi:thiamine-monophosphate kinase